MLDDDQDIIGKIDAMLERRDADFLTDKSASSDDFPTLTDVIEGGFGCAWKGPERRGINSLIDRRVQQLKTVVTDSTAPPHIEDYVRLLSAMEQRLTELIIRQQLQMEDVLRKLIREAMAGGESSKS